MAYALSSIRGIAGPSLYGRRLRLTHADYLAGHKDMITAIHDLTTTPTTLSDYGSFHLCQGFLRAEDAWKLHCQPWMTAELSANQDLKSFYPFFDDTAGACLDALCA